MADYAIDDLIEAIMHAVRKGNVLADEQHQQFIPADGQGNAYFSRNQESGKLHAKTVEIVMPSSHASGNNAESIHVPIISLVSERSVRMSEMTVGFRAYISGISDVNATEADEHDTPKKRLHLDLRKRLFSRREEVDVQITLRSTDPPGGEVKINGEILREF